METLKLGISDDALRDEIRQNLERKIKKYAKEKTLDIYQLRILIDYKEQRKDIFCWSIDDWIKKYWGGIIDPELNEISYSETRVLAFLDYSFENYEYSVINNPYNADVSALKSAYGMEKQFCKYGLVPLKKDRILIPIDSPRIYDASLNKTFFTKNIPLYLLMILKQMMADGILTDFALRLVNERGYKGEMFSEYIKEALEMGKKFDLVNLGSYSVSKLYSAKYEDCLWIVIDQANITFEELCEYFQKV